ncbi:hypothetical protein FB552_1290 [Stenotrophomonas maltophilia]|nr:hypothetical protein FB552_1290 [Stenotrophomonas maltophilia]
MRKCKPHPKQGIVGTQVQQQDSVRELPLWRLRVHDGFAQSAEAPRACTHPVPFEVGSDNQRATIMEIATSAD